MNCREIDFTEHLPESIAMMRTDGLLLNSVSADGTPNVMTIGWGTPGVIWGRPIFIVYVRPSRSPSRTSRPRASSSSPCRTWPCTTSA